MVVPASSIHSMWTPWKWENNDVDVHLGEHERFHSGDAKFLIRDNDGSDSENVYAILPVRSYVEGLDCRTHLIRNGLECRAGGRCNRLHRGQTHGNDEREHDGERNRMGSLTFSDSS